MGNGVVGWWDVGWPVGWWNSGMAVERWDDGLVGLWDGGMAGWRDCRLVV